MKKVLLTLTLIYTIFIPKELYSQFAIDIEGGLIKSGYNDARIPGDEGTLFSFSFRRLDFR